MKLLRAEFQNFRLLRDLEIRFASQSGRKLTVIRAANESGKTTILHALQWALYGDAALPGRGEGFRLHPIDWDTSGGGSVPITATVEFEITTHRRVSGKSRETRRQYRLVRSVRESVDSSARRPNSVVKLFALKDKGADPINAPETLIKEELPTELREVFFTDGDRALSFIEADVAQSTKRDRVQRAIRSLLGLGVMEDALKHVRKSEAEVNKKVKQVGGGSELDKVASRLDEIEEQQDNLENALEDARQQFSEFEDKTNETDKKIAAALQKGNKEELQKNFEMVRRRIKQLEQQLGDANKDHSALFRGESIAADLLAPLINSAYKKLEELYDQGKIPNTTIPVLDERLSAGVCICGETLDANDSGGKRRRGHIQKLINDSRRADQVQETITNLYYSAKPLQTKKTESLGAWLEEYKKIVRRRDEIQDQRDEEGRKYRALDQQIEELPDTDLRGLRETLRQYNEQRDRCLQRRTKIETELDGLQNERKNLEDRRSRLLQEQKKGERILAQLDVTRDVGKVLKNAYEQMANEELDKVSKLMNSIFLKMIGADPEQGAIIRRAEITQAFDIIVYGPNERTLNPDRDLNGASRRALTLAFILALTKVSEVEAPNVIDTPLGMTSGYVKRSILSTAIHESAQLVLFLTHDEIIGCEEIIDGAAGVVFTLTNPAHYPKMLVNDPSVLERKVLRCECNHRNNCQICKRHIDAQAGIQTES